MKSKIIKTIAIILALFAPMALAFSSVYADCENGDLCNCSTVPDEVKASAGCTDAPPIGDFKNSIISILNGVIGVLSLVAVIFIIIGGVNYMTSTGDANKVKKAKDTILYACIGLTICGLAATIVNFVIKNIP